MHFYEGYHFWGMHLIWWFIWVILLIWIFATPWTPSIQGPKKETPLEILQGKYADGKISTEEYEERKTVLERDKSK